MRYVRNAWYVAGWSSEFDESLKRVVILEQAVVMYRLSDGSVVGLEDQCPHRLLPLSKGKRIGDDIQCGYHGMTFNCEGQCVRVPGQDNVPASAFVTNYAVHEKHNIVFIWMGDFKEAVTDDIFDLPQFHSDQWHAHQGDALHLKSHYLNVAENLVDPAHVSFVHPTTLGNAASENVPVHIDTEGEVLVAWRWIRDAPPIGFFQKFGCFEGNVDRWHYYYLHLPCTAVIDFGSADTDKNLPEESRNEGVRIFALHFITPVNEHYTIDRWMHLRNAAVGDEEASLQMDNMFRVAFNEDKEILEAIDEQEQMVQTRKPIRLAIDKGPTVYRRRINAMITDVQ
ncbi:MAG: phenylpropionate dioxygenase-like ring-hydroxylating dioxygenase large terminal subunit [Flavobacteriaceae bacterium]|jgi:phenylpropionate dioxygenase-like ring-hydroxylating dioxygenase large terminal subunit